MIKTDSQPIHTVRSTSNQPRRTDGLITVAVMLGLLAAALGWLTHSETHSRIKLELELSGSVLTIEPSLGRSGLNVLIGRLNPGRADADEMWFSCDNTLCRAGSSSSWHSGQNIFLSLGPTMRLDGHPELQPRHLTQNDCETLTRHMQLETFTGRRSFNVANTTSLNGSCIIELP